MATVVNDYPLYYDATNEFGISMAGLNFPGNADYKEMIEDLKAQVLEDFGEAVKTPEEMIKAQATLAEVAERVMQTMIIENETISAKDLNDLRMMSQQFYLCKEKAQEEKDRRDSCRSHPGASGHRL